MGGGGVKANYKFSPNFPAFFLVTPPLIKIIWYLQQIILYRSICLYSATKIGCMEVQDLPDYLDPDGGVAIPPSTINEIGLLSRPEMEK